MKIKSLIIVILSVLVAVVLIACGGGDDKDTTAQTTTAATTTQAPASTTAAPVVTTAEPEETTTEPEETTAPAIGSDVADWSIYAPALSLTKPANREPATGYTYWDGSIAIGFAGGDGTEANPYLISNGAQLAYLASLTSQAIRGEGQYFALTGDIYLNDLTSYKSWNNTNAPVNVWSPIGTSTENAFSGHFDGRGYTVFGIYTNAAYGGLFGRVQGTTLSQNDMTKDNCTASVKNLTVAYSYIGGDGTVFAGGISAIAKSGVLFENCIVDDTVTVFELSSSSGVGGICGRAVGIYAYKCISSATVIHMPKVTISSDGTFTVGGTAYAGGICGAFWGYIDTCANFGDVYTPSNGASIAGIYGADNQGGTVMNCYAAGTLNSSYQFIEEQYRIKFPNCVGGIAGISGNVDNYPTPSISASIVNVKYNITAEECAFLGAISGKHKQPLPVENVIIVTDNDTTSFVSYEYENGYQLFYSGLAKVTEETLNAHR